MLTIIPFDKEDEDMVNAFFKVAGDFRSARNFQDALNIYEQFLHLPSSPISERHAYGVHSAKLAQSHLNLVQLSSF